MNTDGLGYQTRQELVRVPNPYGKARDKSNFSTKTTKPASPRKELCGEVAREIKSGYEMGELVLLLERQK